MKTFRSNGKLLLTAEYAVLDGAKALALPTRYGQSLTATEFNVKKIDWTSFNEHSEIWYKDEFDFEGKDILTKRLNDPISERLIQILKAIQKLNPEFLKNNVGYRIVTKQDFNRFWGLGTSSTLINNVAQWAGVDPFKLLNLTFGGSGYDIACAQNNTPIIYYLDESNNPKVEHVTFNPPFLSNLYFVYLEQKQNSRDGIKNYRKQGKIDNTIVDEISNLTQDFIRVTNYNEFNNLIEEHESIIASLISTPPIKSQLFKDFNGAIKSLGAWGGDFILVSSEIDPTTYFNSKGLKTIIPYKEMVL